MNTRRIVIINPFGIGDVLFSTPLIAVLKECIPDSFIGYVCNKRASEVIAYNPVLDKIFIYEKDDYRQLWKRSKIKCINKLKNFLNEIKIENFDTAIDLSLGYQYSFLMKLIGVKKRIGFNYHKRGKFLTDKFDILSFEDKHVIEYYLDLLKSLNIDAGNRGLGPRTYLSDSDIKAADKFLQDSGISKADTVIGIIPGCGASWGNDAMFRRWDAKNFAAVSDYLAEKYAAKIILFGSQKEFSLCESVKSMMKNAAVPAYGKTSVGLFLALASKCSVIVTNDGGPLHMSVSLGVKTVSIFGPVDEKVYGPYPPSDRHITITGNAACRPCYKNFKYVKCATRECLNSIRVESVITAVEKLLEKK